MTAEELDGALAGLRPARVDFAIVLVRDTPLSGMPARICAVLDCAQEHDGDVLSFDASLVLITFHMEHANEKGTRAREAFAQELPHLGPDVSLVHGCRSAFVGDVGTRGRRSYTFLLEGYADCLRELVALQPGEAKQI